MPRTDPTTRFFRHFSYETSPGGCWEWRGAKIRQYGAFTPDWWTREDGTTRCKVVRSHRFAYETWVGPIPEDLTVDHLCNNPGCVRPDHLGVATASANSSRANQRTRCKSGRHELSGSNVIRRPSRPARSGECRACANERRRTSK